MPKKLSLNSQGSNLIMVIAVVASLMVGVILGYLGRDILSGRGASLVDQSCSSYEKAVTDIKTKLLNSGTFGKGEVVTLTGEVSKITDQEIIFSAPLPNPLLDEGLKTRTAVITDKTIVTLKKTKSTEQWKKDNQAGNALLEPLQEQIASLKKIITNCGMNASSTECLNANSDLKKVSAQEGAIYDDQLNMTTVYNGKASDLVGDIQITVEAAKDISNQSKFEAVKITLIETGKVSDEK